MKLAHPAYLEIKLARSVNLGVKPARPTYLFIGLTRSTDLY